MLAMDSPAERILEADSLRSSVWREAVRRVRVRASGVTLIYPLLTDPRFLQITALLSYNILGQFVYGFRISPANLILTVALCAALDVGINYALRRVLIVPISGIISGLGIAMLLRVAPDSYPTLFYVFASYAAITSKYLFRTGEGREARHIFNPSNFGLAVVFLLFPGQTFSLSGQWTVSLPLLLWIALCGIVVNARSRTLQVAGAFLATEAVLALIATPVAPEAASIILRSAFTPALMIFAFHMVTDPRTIPRLKSHRVIFAMLVALLHWLMLSLGMGPQSLFIGLTVLSARLPAMFDRLAFKQPAAA